MRIRRKWFFWLALLVCLVGLFVFKSFTPPILSNQSIAELVEVSVEDDRQFVLIRGHDRSNPVLLFLHGGPGMPAMYLGHAFQRRLEKHFVVVHWDQCGAGKSYKAGQDLSKLRISVLLGDLNNVITQIQHRLGSQKVWIVGHSHGSYLGALYACQNPNDVFTFVGVGQVVNAGVDDRVRELQLAYLREKKPELHGLDDTQIVGLGLESLLFETGGVLYKSTSFMPLLLTGLLAPEYSLFDAINVGRGSEISSMHMVYDRPTDLAASCLSMSVPVAMIMGEQDYVTPVAIAQDYFATLQAPNKQWAVVAKTSHFPHFEDPETFTSILVDLKERWHHR